MRLAGDSILRVSCECVKLKARPLCPLGVAVSSFPEGGQ